MNFEIERKFLVVGDEWRTLTTRNRRIRQAYLSSNSRASIRIRMVDDHAASLTFKSRGADIRRLELEYPIPALEAEALISLREGAVITKVRYDVPIGDLVWEVDIFSGDNEGLILAEVELKHEDQHVELPAWIGVEVTGQAQYYNSSLTMRPFCVWTERAPASAEKVLRSS
jgi:adenylate cyclase